MIKLFPSFNVEDKDVNTDGYNAVRPGEVYPSPVLFYVNEEENILLKVTLNLGWVVSHYNLKSFYEFSCLNV